MGETISTTINPQEASNPSVADQAAAMDKAGELDTTPAGSEERPAWLPPKFKSVEDMAKSYTELEKKLGKGKQAASDGDDDEDEASLDNGDADAPSAEDTARNITKSAGLDFDDMANRYWDEGGLRDTDYKALEKKGIPRHMVDQFIAGQQAITEQRQQDVFKEVGGADNYDQMTSWAAENLSPAEIKAYNKAVNSNDFATVKMAVKGLKARYAEEVGFEPKKQVKGAAGGKTTGGAYRSWAEAMKDMNDPRYEDDPAYRRDVEQKLARSSL